MRIAETIGALLCYCTEPPLKLMRSDAVTSGIGNARLSSFEPMLCRAALGVLPLVLTPFANLTVGKSPETIARLILTAQQKLSPFHHLAPLSQEVGFPLSIRASVSRACTKLSYLPQHPDVGYRGNSDAETISRYGKPFVVSADGRQR